MIYSLSGKLIHRGVDDAVVECGGVGFHVIMPTSAVAALPPSGDVTVYTHLHVREDAMELFGFETVDQKDMFVLLTSVSGVGPKVGIAILNALNPSSILLAISAADHKVFTAANGVGPKLAQRIVLELKDKVKGLDISDGSGRVAVTGGNSTQALAALIALGYNRTEAAGALSGCDETLPTQELIKLALRNISKR